MNKEIERQQHIIYKMFKDAAEGRALEVGDPHITEYYHRSPSDLRVLDGVFDEIDSIPDHNWPGHMGYSQSYGEMGVLAGIAIWDSIAAGLTQIETVETIHTPGLSHDFSQN